VVVTILLPIDVAVGEVIEKTIHVCNEDKHFMRFHYYVANTSKPDREDVKNYFDELD
jgi:hypothetical protein